ncbi:pre-rRNA-processing protein TSR1-like isoform X1 [Dinothrombium tinctorium]|uniref:Pre-rRNA-processing protein TSR1 homolog n=1 Tax=Dinothrombium tinctorium TaxID=1965070 RepID=A0A3S3Q1R3_9ACAR|nr:pre-rRNA-processing protein TSR1-like isoform X1 [Dinothrombium tinctorium]
MQQKHKSGPLKQENKAHKTGRHRSNRSVNNATHGRVEAKVFTKRNKAELRRHERRNQIQQLRKLKKDQTLNEKRKIGTLEKPPVLVALIAFDDQDLHSFVDLLSSCDEQIMVNKNSFELDEDFITNNLILNAVFSHCLPTTLHVVRNLDSVPVKKQSDVKKHIKKSIEVKFPDAKILSADNSQQILQLFNLMGNCKRQKVSFRKHRAQVMAENIDFEPSSDDSEKGTLLVSGFVRNSSLKVNRLIHIPGAGDFQLSSIEIISDPYSFNRKANQMDQTPNVVLKPDPSLQESLESEVPLDEMEGEQTWPSPDEIAASQSETKKIMKKVPKGTSEYQAAWIVENDDEGEENEDEDEDEEENEDLDKDMQPQNDDESEEENDDVITIMDEEYETISVNEGNYDEKLNKEEEDSALRKFREARMEEMFPDEIDTPLDIAAHVRFARYRGLKSFRTSPVDPKENLPRDYAKIIQFENFQRTKKRILSEELDAVAEEGSFVKISVKNVPRELMTYFEANPQHPLILYELLPYEQKMSVINLVLRKHHLFAEPIKSKEKLIFHFGCRRFTAHPIFSCHTNGDKFKYERFMRNDSAVVATIYAPVTFPPASVIVFKEYNDGTQSLVATGSLLSINPDRIIMKRIRLSGHPFKINKKSAVVRYMFFNRDDILWFKPVELRTKYGRKGHIKEPLGTHGHMKCTFDKPLRSEDTVMMNLYKRVFPKWNYELYTKNYIVKEFDGEQMDE